MSRRAKFAVFFGLTTATVLSAGLPAAAVSESNIEAKKAEVATAQARLNQLRAETGVSFEAYNNEVLQLQDVDKKLAATESELPAAEERLGKAQESFQGQATKAYKNGNVGFLGVVLGADDFTEFATRVEVWVRLLKEGQAEYEKVQDAKQELAQTKTSLETQRNQRMATVEMANEKKKRASDRQAEVQAYLASMNSDLRSAIQAEEARRAEQARAAAEAERQETIRAAAAKAAAAKTEQTTPATTQQPSTASTAAQTTKKQETTSQAEVTAAQGPATSSQTASTTAAETTKEQTAPAQPSVVKQNSSTTSASSAAAGGGSASGSASSGTSASPDASTSSGASVSSGASASTSTDDFGGVQPHVASVGNLIRDKFGISTIYGYRAGDPGDHGSGLALDFMTYSDSQLGSQVASYLKANWSRFGISYIIYQQRIDLGSGWEPMEDRGSPTQNHMDHVHVSFLP